MSDDLREARRDSWDDLPDYPDIMERPDPIEAITDDEVLPWPPK